MKQRLSGAITRSCVLAAVCGFWAAQGLADVPVSYTQDGRSVFSVVVPDFWSVRTGGPRALTAPGTDDTRDVARVLGLSPTEDAGIWVGLTAPLGVSTLAQGVEYLRDVGPSLVHDAEVDSEQRIRVNGMPAVSFRGRGRRDWKTVHFTAILVDLPGSRSAVAVAVMETGIDPMIVTDVNTLLGSLRSGG